MIATWQCSAAITDKLSERTKFRMLQLFLLMFVAACLSFAPHQPHLSESDFQTNSFLSFFHGRTSAGF